MQDQDWRRKSFQAKNLQAENGVTIVEYAILLGLVLVVGGAGYMVLGDSVKDLLAHASSNSSASSGTMQLLNASTAKNATAGQTGATTLQLKGSGYYKIGIDPTTGQSQMTMVEGSSGVLVNVNSLEGSTSRYNTLGSAMLAKKLDELADAQTDPSLKSYYSEMAKMAYYLSGAEGVLDNAPPLSSEYVDVGDIDPATGKLTTYTLGDGLRDIYQYRNRLESLLNNPPASANKSTMAEVMPYAVDVLNIGQSYISAYQQFIQPDGTVPKNFANPNMCTTTGDLGCGVGSGPGTALENAANVTTDSPYLHEMRNKSYDQLVDLDTLKARETQLLVDNQADTIPVKASIVDAQTVETKSQKQ